MTKIQFEILWETIKAEVIEDWNLSDEDLEDPRTINSVQIETEKLFKDETGLEYSFLMEKFAIQ